jgi:hypothetical protein
MSRPTEDATTCKVQTNAESPLYDIDKLTGSTRPSDGPAGFRKSAALCEAS